MAKKSPKADLQNLPAPAAEFIRLVIKKMRYRRKVRVDVMAELAAHFEDALRDCKNDEEREQKAQRLIEDFGDVKLLAALLRRAKKRCRPLWRTVVARTFQTAGILILCLIAYVAWFLSGKPVITTDYVARANEIVRPVAADERLNAAPIYQEAVELYEQSVEAYEKEYESGFELELFENEHLRVTFSALLTLAGVEYNKIKSEQKALIRKWMDENERILDLLVTGTNKPYYWHEYKSEDGQAISILMPNLSGYRRLGKNLLSRAYIRAEEGLYEDAFTDTLACYRLGKHLEGDKSLVEQLVGFAIRILSVQTIRGILSEHRIDSALLVKLQRDLGQVVSGEDFVVSYELERLLLYDELQRCFTAGPDGHIIPRRLIELSTWGDNKKRHFKKVFAHLRPLFAEAENFRNAAYVLFRHPSRAETLESANAFYDYCEQLASKSPAQVDKNETQRVFEELSGRNFLLAVLTPALERIIEISYRRKAETEATLTIIAILRYRQVIGNFPESLDELITGGYLKELPLDPFSNKPLIYKKAEGDFVLYSVGLNFIDDGGKLYRTDMGRPRPWADEGDAVFWAVAK